MLFTTRGSTGHQLPLDPYAHAAIEAGHEVLVAAQGGHGATVQRAGLPFAPLGDPPDEEWMPLLAAFGRLSVEAAHERMVADFFGRIDTRATLPGLRALAADWRPDVILRESWEFASTLVADAGDIPLVRVALGSAALEASTIGLVAGAVDEARAAMGLSPDPTGARLDEAPLFTSLPAGLEDPSIPPPAGTRRFGFRPAGTAPELPDWWPGNDDPLVYASFGTVAAGAHLPYFPALYQALVDALAPLPVRLLVTVGADADPAALGAPPANVRVERWVAQEAALRSAALVVCHGGYGTTVGALAHGVPLVVVPLFSFDQWINAAAVARAGAGIALDGDRATRQVLALPGPEVLGGMREAVERVLRDPAYGRGAAAVAAGVRDAPPASAALDLLEALRPGVDPPC